MGHVESTPFSVLSCESTHMTAVGGVLLLVPLTVDLERVFAIS
jgi:hypothetical protein